MVEWNREKSTKHSYWIWRKNGEQIPYVIKTVAGYTNKVNIKILKQNEKYAIVDNYKSDELKKLGYTAEEIEDRKTIGLYDEILKNAK